MNKTRDSFLPLPPTEPLPTRLAFLRQARFALSEEYRTKINRTVSLLDHDEVWWRPNEESTSIGNLLLHLAGNSRQWIIAGVGGVEDLRDRNREFSQRAGMGKADLLALLNTTIEEVDAVLAGLEEDARRENSEAPLQRVCAPQGFDQTVLDAICHVVQHFSYHTGQIVFIAKLLVPGGVRFYDDRVLAGE